MRSTVELGLFRKSISLKGAAAGLAGGAFLLEAGLLMGVPVVNSLAARPYEIKGEPLAMDCAKNSPALGFATGLGEGQTLGLSGVDLFIAPLDPLVVMLGTGDGGLKVRVRNTANFVEASLLEGEQIKGVNFTKNGLNFSESGKNYDATYSPSTEEIGKTSIRLVMSCITG